MFDTSWIQEAARIQDLCENPKKENVSSLHFVSLFISQQEIVKVEKETRPHSGPVLKNEHLRKHVENYLLKDILHFHVPLEPEQVPLLSESASFLQSYTVLDDIPIPPSLFIFHSINTIYLCFHERKSSLKSGTRKLHVHFRKTRKL